MEKSNTLQIKGTSAQDVKRELFIRLFVGIVLVFAFGAIAKLFGITIAFLGLQIADNLMELTIAVSDSISAMIKI